jgi:hypothetical protein
VSQSSEFCSHNPLCCFSTSKAKGKRIYRYRLKPETYGYTLLRFTKYHKDDEVKEVEIGEGRSTHGRGEECVQNFGQEAVSWKTDA